MNDLRKHGTYAGAYKHLIGQTALLIDSKIEGCIRAQFDSHTDAYLRDTNLAYGWHEFPASDFQIDPPVDGETPEPQ